MPTYAHICTNPDCANEWEDYYSIKADPPKTCPKCQQETAQRVISGGSGRGVVEVYGHELVAKIKEETKQLKKDMHKNESTYANLLGESRYESLQQRIDKQKRER